MFSPVFGGVRHEEPVSEAVAADEPEVAEPVEAATHPGRTRAAGAVDEPEAPAAELDEPEAAAAEVDEDWYDDVLSGTPATPVAEDEPVGEPSSPRVDEPVYASADDWGDNPLGTPAAALRRAGCSRQQ